MSDPDSRELYQLLAQGLEELGAGFDEAQVHALLRLTRTLAAWAPRINLTAHLEPRAIIQRLILDAAALAQALPPFEHMVDIGSGAGFPGLPIAILHPERRLTSIESRGKRVSFQREVVRSLSLTNTTILHARAESLDPRPADLVVAQAVAKPALALELMLAWARPDATLAIPGTTHDFGESIGHHQAVRNVEVVEYRVPCGGAGRTLWLARRA